MQASQKADERLHSVDCIGVERNERDERLARLGVVDQMKMDGRRAGAVNNVQAIVTDTGRNKVEVSR